MMTDLARQSGPATGTAGKRRNGPIRAMVLCLLLTAFATRTASGAPMPPGPRPESFEPPSRLVVVDDSEYAPFAFIDAAGHPAGISIDIWNLWSRKTGIEVEFRLMEWESALAAVRNGEADVVAGLFRTPEREQYLDFTRPFFTIETSVFFNEQIHGISGIKDLKGFTIGVVKGDSAIEFIREIDPDARLAEYPGSEALVKAALAGEVKVFVSDTEVAEFYLAKFDLRNIFRETLRPESANKQYAAVKKGNTALLAFVQKGFDQITDDEIRAIVNSWTGRPLFQRIPWVALGGTLGVVALLLGAILVWNRQLKRTVSKALHENALRNEKLQESEARFRTLVENQQEPILIIAFDGTVLFANPAAFRLVGVPQRELDGNYSFAAFLAPAYLKPALADLREIQQTGGPIIGEYLVHGVEGESRWVEASGIKIVFEGVEADLVTLRDLTERRRAEEERALLQAQLLQAQKMESIGRLAGGVAHDFNNMLGVIVGHTDLVLEELSEDDPLRKNMSEIDRAARHSTDLTRQLLAFARKQTVTPKVLNLNDTVSGMLKMLKRLIGENIGLNWIPGDGLWPVHIDPSQIDQILANLCVNARDAIGSSGAITIETDHAILDGAYCATHVHSVPGEYVVLSVSDSGCGMKKETMAMIFEPFFTTKGVGEGTGLGLATVYGIMSQNGGFINVYSEPGLGTNFKLFFPRHRGDVPAAQALEPPDEILQGHETILLVEDEPAILHIARTLLERLGYRVLAAASPDEALRLAGQNSAGIQLLMTDLVMPGMNGVELAEQLMNRYPGIKRLFMSGYASNVIQDHHFAEREMHFIQKPFTRRQLAAKVREALDGK